MSKRSERLLALLGQVDDGKIDEAADYRPGKNWKRWASAAAVLTLVVGLGGAVLFPRMGGNAGAAGHEEGSTFMSYAGPVLPMTLREENDAITARRDITLDFQPWVPEWESVEDMLENPTRAPLTQSEREKLRADLNQSYPKGGTYRWSDRVRVVDSYTLTNGSDTDQTVSVLYPFVSQLQFLHENRPMLRVGGQPVETELHAGGYPGSFGPVAGDEERDPEDAFHLTGLNSWEDYRDQMESGAYRSEALRPVQDLNQMEATVYQITLPPVAPGKSESVPNTRVTFRYDPNRTQLLNSGFHGFSANDDGSFTFLAGRNSAPHREEPSTCYLICLGDELTDLTLDDRDGGGWDANTPKLDCRPGQIERYTMGLGQAVDQVMQQPFLSRGSDEPEELVRAVVWDWVYKCILQDQIQRYNYGNIDDIYHDARAVNRVFWLEGTVTIPAGASVTVVASLDKEPSFDYACVGGVNRGVNGYDMMTTLDSNLNFTEQTASLKDRGQICIVRQNYGFDLKNGVSCVTLERKEAHYYLEVRRKEGTIPAP